MSNSRARHQRNRRQLHAMLMLASLAFTSACTNTVADLDDEDVDVEGRWNYTATTQDKLTPTYCSVQGIVSIEQYGNVLEGRLTALASCTARGFAFGEALNERIVDGSVSGTTVRFGLTPSNCTHSGSMRSEDGRIIRGDLVGNCNHTGSFTLTRQ